MSQQVHDYWPHELVAGDAVNCRPGDEDVADLVASIASHGLLQPLVGRARADGAVEIVDGNRRLKALTELFDAGTVTAKVPVMLRAEESEADAFEISLAANVLRKPLHPVTEFEAFAALADKGKDKQEIAEHFGIPLRAVEQRLALGRLHAEVRKAWLEGRINGEAARAFTIAEPAEQAAYLATAREPWQLRSDTIRRHFVQESVPGDRPIARFVGEEAYRAAGSEMLRDLFVEQPQFADGGLLQRLADDKLATCAARLKEEEGWAEVLFGTEASDSYKWDRLAKPAQPQRDETPRITEIKQRLQAIDLHIDKLDEALLDVEDETRQAEIAHDRETLCDEQVCLEEELESFDDERAARLSLPEAKRARAIATVGIGHDGELTIARGYLKGSRSAPAPAPSAMARPEPKASSSGAAEEAPEPTRLSAALLDDLALTATRAAAHVLAGEPRIALAAFVATSVSWGTPLRLENKGRGEGPKLPWPVRDHNTEIAFGAAFRAALGWDDAELAGHAATVIARTLDFTSKALVSHSYDSLRTETVTDLRAALPAELHRAALVGCFDAEAYFATAPKQEALDAIRDCGDDPGKHTKLKKADLAAVAARLAGQHAWLPPLLRGAVFEATAPIVAEDDQNEPALPLAEIEEHQSAAEAALQIWREQDGVGERQGPVATDDYEALKTPALRTRLKDAGIKVPFGATRDAILQLVRDSEQNPADAEQQAA